VKTVCTWCCWVRLCRIVEDVFHWNISKQHQTMWNLLKLFLCVGRVCRPYYSVFFVFNTWMDGWMDEGEKKVPGNKAPNIYTVQS